MRIVYMGTPDFAVEPLEAILAAGHQVCAVVTQPDKQKGRGRQVQFSPVKECALKAGIPVLQPVKIKAAEAVEELRALPADIFVVAAFGQILSEEILNMPKFGCINIHASLLPKYRGAAPIQWAILNGETATGVTIIQMNRGIDTGDMLLKGAVPITAKETGATLQDKLSALGSKLVVEALEQIAAGQVQREKQDDTLSCYAPMLAKELGAIQWDWEAARIERLIRGLDPWPDAYTYWRGKTLKIYAASVVSQTGTQKAGYVEEVTRDSICIVSGSGVLRIEELQLEGKKRMPVKEFLMGNQMTVGEKLG